MQASLAPEPSNCPIAPRPFVVTLRPLLFCRRRRVERISKGSRTGAVARPRAGSSGSEGQPSRAGSLKGSHDERCTGAGGDAQGGVRAEVGWEPEELGCVGAVFLGVGDLSREGVAG